MMLKACDVCLVCRAQKSRDPPWLPSTVHEGLFWLQPLQPHYGEGWPPSIGRLKLVKDGGAFFFVSGQPLGDFFEGTMERSGCSNIKGKRFGDLSQIASEHHDWLRPVSSWSSFSQGFLWKKHVANPGKHRENQVTLFFRQLRLVLGDKVEGKFTAICFPVSTKGLLVFFWCYQNVDTLCTRFLHILGHKIQVLHHLVVAICQLIEGATWVESPPCPFSLADMSNRG